jgi:hypothetical protein
MTTRRLASFAAVAALLISRAASAQPQYTAQADSPQWLKDRRYNEGIGIRTGDFELHPGVAGEFGYDSNWFLRSSQAGVQNAPVVESLPFRITPSLYLSTLGPQRREGDIEAVPPSLAFRAGINATYHEYINVSGQSGQQNDISRERNVSGSADARLDIEPGRPVGGSLAATYAHVFYPNQQTADPNQSFAQENVSAAADLAIQPGSGTLDWHFGYQFAGAFFDYTPGTTFNNYTNQAYTRGRWRFRPRTALLYDATLGFTNYTNTLAAQEAGLVNSTPVRARIGLNGLITDRFAVLALIGWGASFYSNALGSVPQFDNVIGQAEVKWFLAASPGIANASELGLALSSIAVGYNRDFQNSYFGNFYQLDRGYLRFNYFFSGRVLVTLEGGVGAVEYPESFFFVPGPVRRANGFTDVRADATLFSEYRFTDTFGINATLRYTENFSQQIVPETATSPDRFGMAWQRFEAYLGVRWFM